MKKPVFVENEIYHIYNRGVEKRNIFLDDEDRFLFIHNLFEFNDKNPTTPMSSSRERTHLLQIDDIKRRKKKESKEPLVEILGFVLMDNHYHLLLRQKIKNGIVKFQHKLGTGYTMFFNKKYERVGSLFQGRFKAKVVEKDSHFLYLPHYVHFNPLDFKFPEWRKGAVKNYKAAIGFLENYRWSSFLDYIGKKNFPLVTKRDFLLDFWGGEDGYKKEVENLLQEGKGKEILVNL